jgi:hypothetical protein
MQIHWELVANGSFFDTNAKTILCNLVLTNVAIYVLLGAACLQSGRSHHFDDIPGSLAGDRVRV